MKLTDNWSDEDFEIEDLSEDEDFAEEEYDYAQEDDLEEDDSFDKRSVSVIYRIMIPVLAVLVLFILIVAVFFVFKTNHDDNAAKEVTASVEEQETKEQPMTEPSADTKTDTDAADTFTDAAENGTGGGEGAADKEEATGDNEAEEEDPQTANMGMEQGTAVDVTALLSSGSVAETADITMGIDVARYQGTIDWEQVAASGIDFAMVRVGYRSEKSREICEDTNARYNMQEAQKNGIKIGAYFFSTAVSTEEAVAEADWVADYISKYQITYPVAYDCEGFDSPDSVQFHLTNAERTDIALAFLQQIYNKGYTPMFYAAMGELTDSAKWDTQRIENICKIWVSQYPAAPYPQTPKSSYSGTHAMWQYTNRGAVAGISQPVDVNIAYFGYEGTADAQNSEAPEEASADVEALMNFTDVSEQVTAKDSTNLRDIPSQGSDSKVVYTLQNGETVTRTGVSDSGWSRVSYNGQTLYAVSSYLTADLSYEPPVQEGAESGDGLKTKFEERNEQVTAKIEVNLRALPSVTNPDAAVIAVLHNGEYVTRTGINEEYGWSRVDYNGQVLYCISSYLTQ